MTNNKNSHIPAFVYILSCRNGSLYTGATKNPKSRVQKHFQGQAARYTRIYKPQALIYLEPLENLKQAYRREAQIKKMSRKQKQDLLTTLPSKQKRIIRQVMVMIAKKFPQFLKKQSSK